MSTRPIITKIIRNLHKATKRAAALRKADAMPKRRQSPQFDAMMAALETLPLGATTTQLRGLTGIAGSTADANLKRALESGEAFMMGATLRRVYFSTAALLEASRARVLGEWAATDKMFADRKFRRDHRIPIDGALPVKKAKKAKEVKIRVFGEMPLRQAKKILTTQSPQWKESAARITSETIITQCPSPAYVPMPKTTFRHQYGVEL